MMAQFTLSVVIPTYNRKESLNRCLTAISNQSYSKINYEVLIIDDGSTDGTEEMVKEIIKSSPVKIKYFQQENSGPARARNVGIKNAEGKIVLFIGDDIIADARLLEEHVRFHEKFNGNIAVLGYITWPKEMKILPFMKYLNESIVQFGYHSIKDKMDVPYNFFYSSNISLKKSFLSENDLFDEDFRYAAFEDVEFGYRLKKGGLVIKYNENAIGYHYHMTDFKKYCNRMFYTGKAETIFRKKLSSNIFLNKYKQKGEIFRNRLESVFMPILRNVVYLLDKKGGRFVPQIYRGILSYYYRKGIIVSIKDEK